MLLQAKQAVKRFSTGSRNEVTAVNDVSLELAAGEFLAIQGPSGGGKSTLLLMLGGLLRPESGTIKINGRQLYELSSEERAALRATEIGFVFQQFHLIPYLTVRENVLAPGLAPRPAGKVLAHAELEQRADELINSFGLESRANHKPGELSTGERQRTALARALLFSPPLLLADEPTGNLDDENARIVLTAMKDYCAAGGGVLLVTHDARASEFADRTLTIRDGELQTENVSA
ncbi:Lipoprotein-releasing system ATP-binding protein LolD [Polystyrenella longa]|uniref:Lipoprotein-releasing system ATP-binding protein LolD n=1 Tax=Polystyrenella longa TaxID=2528007 RepID=A0A518CUG1_9PLAN|nr:ABC transporter ATP-binding protein [Polystyrenella longa]QDU82855.1 Lipoprotein-releasing system ATP-binding protein LolD [Polystyrenella longa]